MTQPPSTGMDAAAYTSSGTARERVPLPAQLFDGTVNVPVMHQAVKAYLANQRQGTASTKTRGLVAGGNRKPWKQKGTGRARQGSIRAPHWVGGGTVFGPTPRSYDQYVPKQVRALARKSAFNARASEGALLVVDRLEYEAPKTSLLAALLARLGLAGQKVLILTDGVKTNVYLSGRNLPTVQVMPYSDVSAYHVLWSDAVVVESSAFGQTLAPVVEREADAQSEAERPKAARGRARERAAKKGGAKAEAARGGEGRGAGKRAARGDKSAARSAAKKSPTRKRDTKHKGK